MAKIEAVTIENTVCQFLTGDLQIDTLDFITYLRANEMSFERGQGYWENQFYWLIKYKAEYVCFILVNGTSAEEKFAPLTIWSDDSNSNWYEDSPLNERMKEFFWNNVDFCENCGSCSGGKRKIIFGKEFDNVCCTTFRFINPDAEALECVKKIVLIRKKDILNNYK